MLLSEYAIIPDVFVASCYDHDSHADIHLQNLKEVLLSEAVIRDLHGGTWATTIDSRRDRYHPRSLELLKKLRSQSRLIITAAIDSSTPSTDVQWCTEALGSHRSIALNGILAMELTVSCFTAATDKEMIGVLGQLNKMPWWEQRSGSIRPTRTTHDYAKYLKLILSCSNSVMFIDPHLDPGRENYREFGDLFKEFGRRGKTTAIEIHRVIYEGSGRNRQIVSKAEWEKRFSDALSVPLTAAGLSAKVFIWDDFHDRYLISNLIGVQLSNGFDVSSNTSELTTWTRLSRSVRDNIQREFDPAVGKHKCHYSFVVP